MLHITDFVRIEENIMEKKLFIIFVFLVCVPFSLFAEDFDHSQGSLFLRLSAGPSFSKVYCDELGENIDGFGYSANLSIGYTVFDKLIISGELARSGAFDVMSDYKNKYDDYSDELKYDDAMLVFSGLGLGITYYTDDNFNFKIVMGMAEFELDTHKVGLAYTVDKKFFISAFLGKEWAVSENWGVGLSAAVTYASTEIAGYDVKYLSPAILLTASYN